MNALLAAAALKVAVLDLEASGVDPVLAKNLSEVLVNAVYALGDLQVVAKSDIQAMLGFEREKQLLSCADESSCLAEIGGALGVEKIVVGSVGRVEELYLLNLKLIDIRSARVEGRLSETVEGRAAPLVAAIRARVPELFAPLKRPGAPALPAGAAVPAPAPVERAAPHAPAGAAEAGAAKTRAAATVAPAAVTAVAPAEGPGAAPPATRAAEAPPRTLTWIAAGVATVAAGGASVLGWLTLRAYDGYPDPAAAEPVARGRALTANVLWGVAAAGAATAAVFFVLEF